MVRTRIAPSPTGIAHIGTAYYAIYNYAVAKKNNGEFIVRIEDTDRTRFVEGAEQAIFDALSWLAIPHDEGPDIGGPHAPYRQSERLPIYKKHAEDLITNGYAYYCFCSPEILDQIRKEQQARKELPRYDRRCRSIALDEAKERVTHGEGHVIRMKIPDNETISWDDLVRGKVSFESNGLDDQVIIKSDGFPTYHLAVVIDDELMQISHVLRGEEWISSTPKHILLYRYFGWKLPHFAHMPLLRNSDKSKMSKRKNDVSIFSYRDKGYLPEAFVNYLCLMGWSHPEGKDIFTYEEYIRTFSIERMQKTGPVFDIQKLTWMNQQYIQSFADETLQKRLVEFYKNDTAVQSLLKDEKMGISLIQLAKTRMKTLSEFQGLVMDNPIKLDEREKIVAVDLQEVFNKILDWNKDEIFSLCKQVMGKHTIKMPLLYKIFTGKERGLPLPEYLALLGKEKTVQRLNALLMQE